MNIPLLSRISFINKQRLGVFLWFVLPVVWFDPTIDLARYLIYEWGIPATPQFSLFFLSGAMISFIIYGINSKTEKRFTDTDETIEQIEERIADIKQRDNIKEISRIAYDRERDFVWSGDTLREVCLRCSEKTHHNIYTKKKPYRQLLICKMCGRGHTD